MALLPLISSIGCYGVLLTTGLGSADWPGAADMIIYVPVRIPEDCNIGRVFVANGGAVSGNMNVGLYDSTGSKLWECGSTAQSGTSQLQFITCSQSITAGLHYMALQLSNYGTAQVQRKSPTLWFLQVAGVMQEQAGSFALPATATFAKLANAYLPAFGLDLRGAV